jgi:hypothetical protein
MRRRRHTGSTSDHRRCDARAHRSGLPNLAGSCARSDCLSRGGRVSRGSKVVTARSSSVDADGRPTLPKMDRLGGGQVWGRNARVETSGRLGIKHRQRLAAFISAPFLHFRTPFCEPAAPGTPALQLERHKCSRTQTCALPSLRSWTCTNGPSAKRADAAAFEICYRAKLDELLATRVMQVGVQQRGPVLS